MYPVAEDHNLKMSDKPTTIYDIAAQLNLSAATVSRALKNDPKVKGHTKKKVLKAASEMGYQKNWSAQSLRTQKSNIIGVIVPRLNSHFMSAVISGAERIANKQGYHLIISQSEELVEKEIANATTMFSHRVDGLLVSLAYNTPDLHHFDDFFRKKIPLIFFDRIPSNTAISSIKINNTEAAYTATQHLIQEGCMRILHVTANTNYHVYLERFTGYKKALEDHHLPFSNSLLLFNDLSHDAGKIVAKTILEMNPLPDGIFFANDNCATGCMLVLKQAGVRIPEDIAIVGFNNDPVATIIEPHLSSISYNGDAIGQMAVQVLLDQLENDPNRKPFQVILQSELIIRASSKRQMSPSNPVE